MELTCKVKIDGGNIYVYLPQPEGLQHTKVKVMREGTAFLDYHGEYLTGIELLDVDGKISE